MKRYWPDIAIAVGLALLTIGAYYQVAGHDWVGYDDAVYVTQNPHVKSGLNRYTVTWVWTSEVGANWHPLTMLSHIVDYQLYELDARGHYVTNLIFHLIDVVLLFVTIPYLVRSRPGAAAPGAASASDENGLRWKAAFVAALFAVHPLHVESVAWIAERKDVLSTMFLFLALLAYGWYVRRPSVGRMAWVAVAMGLGLMAKPMLVTLPAVLLLLDYWPLGRWAKQPGEWLETVLRLVVEKLPLFGLSIASSVITYFVQEASGATRSFGQYSIDDRVANALMAYLQYIGKMFWPVNLTCLYPHPGRYLFTQPYYIGLTILATLVLFVVTAAAFLLRRRAPYLIVGWLWYLGTLVPVIGLVQVGSQAYADRYTYIPLIGLFVMLAWGLPDLLARVPGRLVILATAGVAVVLVCTGLTWRQVQVWENNLTLWQHSLDTIGDTADGLCGVATPLSNQGKLDEAYELCQRALVLEPNSPFAHHCTGAVLMMMKRYEEALEHYDKSIELDPRNHLAFSSRGWVQGKLKQYDKAIADYRRAIELEPRLSTYHIDLAKVLVDSERYPLAEDEYRFVLSYDADHADAHAGLGNLLARRKQNQEAIEHYRCVIELRPTSDEIRENLAILLADEGSLAEAAEHYDELLLRFPKSERYAIGRAGIALRLRDVAKAIECYGLAVEVNPESIPNRIVLASALYQAGKLEEAEAACTAALAIAPDSTDAHYNLALIHSAQQDFAAAARDYEAVLRIAPERIEAKNNLAWLLATVEASTSTEIDRAVVLAEEVCSATERQDPSYLDTLAVAYARAGRFDDAVHTAREAIERARELGQKAIENDIQERLKLYEAGKHFAAG